MKRIAWSLGAVALAAIALFAFLITLLPRETLTARVGQQISAWTGRDVSLRGEPEFDFFPELKVTLKDVQVGGPDDMRDAAILSTERLEGKVRFWPLIIGQVEIGSFTMVRPLIRLVREDAARNWAFDSSAAALQLAFAGDVPLGEFVLEDGTVIYENRGARVTERIDSVNLSLAWPSVRQPLSVRGSGIWRGEQVVFSANASRPFEFLNGGATPVDAQLDSARIAALFSGRAADVNNPQLAGTLSMSTPSLRQFARWLGNPAGPGSTLGPASLSGSASFQDRTLSVENAQLALDGNTATGALRVVAAIVPEITGTLAFPTIDLTLYFAGLAAALETGVDWRKVEIATEWFRDFTADIRLSAGQVQIGQLRFGATAASVSLRDLRLEIGVGQATFGGGSVSGNLAVSSSAGGPAAAVEAQLRGNGVDLAQAGPTLGVPSPMSGRAAMSMDLAGNGRDFGQLANSLAGTARLDVENGAFPLFGIAELAAGGASTSPQQPMLAAAAPVNALSALFSFSGGVANLDQASIVAPSFRAEAKGWIGLLDGGLGLSGTVVPAAPAGAQPVPFTIGGTLTQPTARPLARAN